MQTFIKYQELIRQNPDLFNNKDTLFEIILDKQKIIAWMTNKKEALKEIGLPEEWGDIGVEYEDPYILLIRDLVKFPDGNLGSYFRILGTADLQGGQAIAILPFYDNRIVVLRQFRHPTRKWHWEIPRGFGEPNISPEENARKEIFEEISGEISEITDLGEYNSNTGIEGGTVRLFFAKLKAIGKTNEEEGIVSYQLFEIAELEEMIRKSEITDGFTIAAFTRARLNKFI